MTRDLRRLVEVELPNATFGERPSPARDPERRMRQQEALVVSADILNELIADQEG